MRTFIFDLIGGYYYRRGTGEPLSQYIPETFARVTMSGFFRCMRIADGTQEYYLRKDPRTDVLELKVYKL